MNGARWSFNVAKVEGMVTKEFKVLETRSLVTQPPRIHTQMFYFRGRK